MSTEDSLVDRNTAAPHPNGVRVSRWVRQVLFSQCAIRPPTPRKTGHTVRLGNETVRQYHPDPRHSTLEKDPCPSRPAMPSHPTRRVACRRATRCSLPGRTGDHVCKNVSNRTAGGRSPLGPTGDTAARRRAGRHDCSHCVSGRDPDQRHDRSDHLAHTTRNQPGRPVLQASRPLLDGPVGSRTS
jgi:hypothetical protein